jgi:glycogen debranching enzyme
LASNQFLYEFPKVKNPLFKITMAAGLPHFAIGWARSWGRDTFISTELLLLHPHIFRNLIIGYASTMRHSLIPNLLDLGENPRYNCRDSTWWYIRAVK